MKTSAILLVWFVLLGWVYGERPNAADLIQSSNQNEISTKIVKEFHADGDPALQTILRLGETAKVPVGVIVTNNSLCESKIKLAASKETFGAAMNRITNQIPGYQWVIRDGVAVVAPRVIPEGTSHILNLVIPRYAAPESTLRELAAFLHTDVRGVLRPDQGTAEDVLSSSNDPRTAPFEMRNASVEQILNRMITLGNGAAWILLPIPKDFHMAADHDFVQVVAYPDTQGRIDLVSCQK